MKYLSKVLVFIVTGFSLAACATTFKPAPIGDSLVWSSASDRPGWTVNPPKTVQGDTLVFTGQSLYHSTERGARTSAEMDASANAATYLSRHVKRDYTETTSGGVTENGIQNPHVTTKDVKEITADQVLNKLETDDWYLEQWRKGDKILWKAFVKVSLPKNRS